MGKIIYQPKKKIKQVNMQEVKELREVQELKEMKESKVVNEESLKRTPVEDERYNTLIENIDSVKPVGDTDCDYTLYLEDYVYTYMYQYASTDLTCEHSAAIVGERYPDNNEIIICGIIPVRKDKLAHPEEWINQEALEAVYEEQETYFPNTIVLGWLHMQPGYGTMLSMKEVKVHRDLFNRQGSVLLLIDPVNKIETFYIYEGDQLIEQSGYYIYYDKNTTMQQYMLDNPFMAEQEEIDDSVVTQFREIGRMRKKEYQQRKRANFTVIAASVALLAMTAYIVNNGNQQDIINGLNNELNSIKQAQNQTQNQTTQADGQMPTVVIGETDTNTDADTDDLMNQEAVEVFGEGDGQAEGSDVEVITVDTADGEAEEAQETSGEVEEVSAEVEPVVTEVKEAANAEAEEEVQNYLMYTVEEGDSLRSISYKHFETETRTRDIIALNGIENGDIIHVGDQLKIPQ